jgi:integrase
VAIAGTGLRLGEIRALRWQDVDLDADSLTISRSALPTGEAKETKTAAGERTVPMLPAVRRALVKWRLKSPRSGPEDLVICTAEGGPVAERNLRRALVQAITKVKLTVVESERLSWHSLRHSGISTLATETGLAHTSLARIAGHTDGGFTMRVYAKDARDDAALVKDVLQRAKAAGIGQ